MSSLLYSFSFSLHSLSLCFHIISILIIFFSLTPHVLGSKLNFMFVIKNFFLFNLLLFQKLILNLSFLRFFWLHTLYKHYSFVSLASPHNQNVLFSSTFHSLFLHCHSWIVQLSFFISPSVSLCEWSSSVHIPRSSIPSLLCTPLISHEYFISHLSHTISHSFYCTTCIPIFLVIPFSIPSYSFSLFA